MDKKWVWIVLWVVVAFGLQFYRLADELPANRLGSSGAFLLDEGFYQMSAAHRAQFGEWRMPGNIYGGWTTRGYQMWVLGFFKTLGVNLFAARLASVAASVLGLAILLFVFRSYFSPTFLAVFGALASTDYLWVMWSKIALPYSVVLLPVSLILFFSIGAVTRRSVVFAALAGVATFAAFTVKETGIFFVPVVLLTLSVGILFNQPQFSWWRAFFNRQIFVYLATFILLAGLYHIFFLAPAANAPWNDSAQQAKIVLQQAAQNLARLELHTSEGTKSYGPFEAITKLCLKFFGMKHIFATWALTLLGGVAFLGIGWKQWRQRRTERPCTFLVDLFMLGWIVLVPALLIVMRYQSGLAVHWIPLYLPPIIYFVARGFDWIWHHFRFPARGLVFLLFCFSVSWNLLGYFRWLREIPQENPYNAISHQIAQTILARSEPPVLAAVDCPVLVLREPEVQTIALREFHYDFFPEMYQAWKPSYLLFPDAAARPHLWQEFKDHLQQQGFSLEKIEAKALGVVDGSEMTLALYKIHEEKL